MKTFSGILAMALSLCLLLSLLMVAPLGAGAPSIKAPEAELLWDEGTEHDVADLATGDLNGDGKDDVVSLSPLTLTLVAWSGDDGSILWYDESISGYAVAVGDITGDGINEVIAGGWDDDYDLAEGSNFGRSGGFVINVYLANGELDWSYPTNN